MPAVRAVLSDRAGIAYHAAQKRMLIGHADRIRAALNEAPDLPVEELKAHLTADGAAFNVMALPPPAGYYAQKSAHSVDLSTQLRKTILMSSKRAKQSLTSSPSG